MYSVSAYASMLADKPRMLAYDAALAKTVFPGAVVIDIGTGPGVMAMMACRHGAARVYAIEPSPVIAAAREIVALNGLSDRITLIEGLSTEIELPERADVIVSDLRGVLPLFNFHVPSIVDAKHRFLKEGGVLIPQRDRVRIALAEVPEVYSSHLQLQTDEIAGFNLGPLHRLLANSWRKVRVTPGELLSDTADLFELDYTTIDNPDASFAVTLHASRDGEAHGLLVWFDGAVAPGVRIDNAPGADEFIYGQAFFPWSRPASLREGETVRVSMDARLVGEEYVWRWQSVIEHDSGSIRFDQSTFFSAPLDPSRLARRAHTFACALSTEGIVQREILSRMDGTKTNGEIASEIAEIAGGTSAALDRVTRIAEQFGRR